MRKVGVAWLSACLAQSHQPVNNMEKAAGPRDPYQGMGVIIGEVCDLDGG
jgi:hypothetical protein